MMALLMCMDAKCSKSYLLLSPDAVFMVLQGCLW